MIHEKIVDPTRFKYMESGKQESVDEVRAHVAEHGATPTCREQRSAHFSAADFFPQFLGTRAGAIPLAPNWLSLPTRREKRTMGKMLFSLYYLFPFT